MDSRTTQDHERSHCPERDTVFAFAGRTSMAAIREAGLPVVWKNRRRIGHRANALYPLIIDRFGERNVLADPCLARNESAYCRSTH